MNIHEYLLIFTLPTIPPGLVRPGHITGDPSNINLSPPLSTYNLGNRSGYWCSNLKCGIIKSSLVKNIISSSFAIISYLYSDLNLQLINYAFFGITSSAISSNRVNKLMAPYLRSFTADLFSNVGFERSSIFLNIFLFLIANKK